MNQRLEGLFSQTELNKLQNANILLVGVGGVGSFCFETLIRTGIKNITIIDFDTYELSNFNRQLHANINTLDHKKVDVLKKHAKNIDANININTYDLYLDENSNIDFSKYDFIIDACDSIKAKIYLIKMAYQFHKKIICSLGVGNRLNPLMLDVTDLNKTYNDPLAKKLRNELNKIDFTGNVKVVFSKELPIKKSPVASYMAVSSSAGILLADYVIKEVVKNEN